MRVLPCGKILSGGEIGLTTVYFPIVVFKLCEFCRTAKLEADGQRENQFYNRLFIFRCPKFAVGKLE